MLTYLLLAQPSKRAQLHLCKVGTLRFAVQQSHEETGQLSVVLLEIGPVSSVK